MAEIPCCWCSTASPIPHNLGACLRTADAAGAHAVLIPKDRAAAVDGVVRKVAAAPPSSFRWRRVTNLARTIDMLKERGIWVVGTDGEARADPVCGGSQAAARAGAGGAKGDGMRRLTRERCDFLVRIPMAGQVESLNVSVAAGVALFEARRQRDAPELTCTEARTSILRALFRRPTGFTPCLTARNGRLIP